MMIIMMMVMDRGREEGGNSPRRDNSLTLCFLRLVYDECLDVRALHYCRDDDQGLCCGPLSQLHWLIFLPIYGNGNPCTATVLEQDEEKVGDTS